MQREVLSKEAEFIRVGMCAPPGNNLFLKFICQNGSFSLCALRKGSLTIEAALILPFLLTIFLMFFSFVFQYALAAELSVQAAAEAKKIGTFLNRTYEERDGQITIYKNGKTSKLLEAPFFIPEYVTEKAVCREWIGFTKLETEETYVYITPEGSVFHLTRECTHLKLSIERVTFVKACASENVYGERYRECTLCDEEFGFLVYITKEGNCYHSERNCSGLKRTVRQIPISEVDGRSCCIRCISKEEP